MPTLLTLCWQLWWWCATRSPRLSLSRFYCGVAPPHSSLLSQPPNTQSIRVAMVLVPVTTAIVVIVMQVGVTASRLLMWNCLRPEVVLVLPR